jgi:hypothetical protein
MAASSRDRERPETGRWDQAGFRTETALENRAFKFNLNKHGCKSWSLQTLRKAKNTKVGLADKQQLWEQRSD